MQAITSSIQLSLQSSYQKRGEAPVRVFVDKFSYYELFLTLNRIFKTIDYEIGEHLSIEINSEGLATNTEFKEDVIYDFYIASFESNVMINASQIQFVDLNAFVEKQFLLRQKAGHKTDRPLMVLIDNTMSDFDETYLPFFLMQFEDEINKGLLCVLVVHSGNKYLHVGTDKNLAALFYGYYNPHHFPVIDEVISTELAENRMGDLGFNDPTVLLTLAYIQHGLEEILQFSPLIRNRTLHVFNNIVPVKLLSREGFFAIDNPLSNATYQGLSKSCTLLQNSSGFWVVQCLGCAFPMGGFENMLMEKLDLLLNELGMTARDGFGFDETTYAYISVSDQPGALRISIGTESVHSIELSMKTLCDFLLRANALVDKYTQEFNKNAKSVGGLEALNRLGVSLMDSPREVDAIYKGALAQYMSAKTVVADGGHLLLFGGIKPAKVAVEELPRPASAPI